MASFLVGHSPLLRGGAQSLVAAAGVENRQVFFEPFTVALEQRLGDLNGQEIEGFTLAKGGINTRYPKNPLWEKDKSSANLAVPRVFFLIHCHLD